MRGKAIVFVVTLVLFLFAVPGYFAFKLLHPGIHTCNLDKFVYCGDPTELGLRFEEVAFKTADGLRIRGWFIPGQLALPAVISVHGRGVDRREGLRFATALHAAGLSMLLIDLRNCGTSDHSFNSMGYHERKDVFGAVDFLTTQREIKSIGVIGFSMGAATSILAMADDKRIRAGVFEAGFSDLRSIIADVGRNDYLLPRYPLLPLTTWFFEAEGHLRAGAIAPVERIASISPRPVFIIHGTADARVPPDHGDRLFAAAGNPKWLWSVPGGEHAQAWQADRAKAEALVTEFFLKYLLE